MAHGADRAARLQGVGGEVREGRPVLRIAVKGHEKKGSRESGNFVRFRKSKNKILSILKHEDHFNVMR